MTDARESYDASQMKVFGREMILIQPIGIAAPSSLKIFSSILMNHLVDCLCA